MNTTSLVDLVKAQRKGLGLTQVDLPGRAGVGLRFVSEFEQGKATLRMDKVNQVLALFVSKLGPVLLTSEDRDVPHR